MRRAVTASVLLGVLLLLNLAAVLPALHALWHGDHGCDEADCVVVALAQGKADPDIVRITVPEPIGLLFAAPAVPVSQPVQRTDCPSLPGRSPPV